MSRLKVLLVSANYRPSVGGIERYVEILAHGLAEHGHDVTVVACATDGAPRGDEHDGAVDLVRLPATDVLDDRLNVPYPIPEPVTASRTFRRLVPQADVVHAHDALYATSFFALRQAHRHNIPSVLTQHVGFVPQRRRVLDVAQSAAIATIGRSARLATRVVSYNPAVAEWARHTWGLREVQVLPPGVPESPAVDRDRVRREFGLPTDRFLALFVGRDVPKKGLDIFLAARDSAYGLVAVTDRGAADAPPDTHVLPLVAPERFRTLLAAVDAFVLPSEGEGFPLALQEALVSGIPSIVAKTPGYEHYVSDAEVMFVPREAEAVRLALRKLADDAPLRLQLAQRAREAGMREFGLERFIAAYEETYAKALADEEAGSG